MRVVLITQGISYVVQPLFDFLGSDLVAIIESAPRTYKGIKSPLSFFPNRGLSIYSHLRGFLFYAR